MSTVVSLRKYTELKLTFARRYDSIRASLKKSEDARKKLEEELDALREDLGCANEELTKADREISDLVLAHTRDVNIAYSKARRESRKDAEWMAGQTEIRIAEAVENAVAADRRIKAVETDKRITYLEGLAAGRTSRYSATDTLVDS